MALVVEDGTGLATAETLVSEADFVDFATKRGITIDEEQASQHLVKGMDWLTMHEADMTGSRSTLVQALPFPRANLTILNRVIRPDEVPQEAKQAQIYAAIASYSGVELAPIEQNGKTLIRKKTGPLESEWAFDPNKSTAPIVPQAASFLALLSGGGKLRLNQRV